jgi:hypothetical protein
MMRYALLPALLAMPVPVVAAPDAAGVEADVRFLADDLLAGREPGTPGFEIAARYVAARFQAMGLKPAGPDGGWFQPVTLREGRIAGHPRVTLRYGGTSVDLPADQALMRASLADRAVAIDAPLVFVGYGIDRPDLGFDDYHGLDAHGRVVVLLSGYPKGVNSELGAFLTAQRGEMAMKRGAIAVFMINTLQDTARSPWAKLIERYALPVRGWVGADGRTFLRTPGIKTQVLLHHDAAAPLFAASGHALDAVLAEADRVGGRPRGFALKADVDVVETSTWRDIHSENVVALLPGADPALAGQSVVLSAHLDHLGDHAPGTDPIYNGAMDNAAGVATMLASAQALAAAPQRPRRSVLFAALTGEESGLLGSDYLARHPLPAAPAMIADVNIDMPVLLYRFTDVVAFGAEHSSIGPMVAAAAQRDGIALSPDPIPEEGIFTRSDHYSFVRQGIPSVYLMTGFAGEGGAKFRAFLKDHYHQPSDDLTLPFDWQAAATLARINANLATDLANAPTAPRWYARDVFGHEYAPKAPTVAKP